MKTHPGVGHLAALVRGGELADEELGVGIKAVVVGRAAVALEEAEGVVADHLEDQLVLVRKGRFLLGDREAADRGHGHHLRCAARWDRGR